MIKFVIRAKKNPLKRDQVKFYPQMAPGVPVMLRTIVGRIEKRSGVSSASVKAVLDALQYEILQTLSDGNSVRLGDLGSFRLTMHGEGVTTAKEAKEKGGNALDGEDLNTYAAQYLKGIISNRGAVINDSDNLIIDDMDDDAFANAIGKIDLGEVDNRGEDVDAYLKYENQDVKLSVLVNQDDLEDYEYIATDSNGNVIQDYPLPIQSRLSLNRSTMIATDEYGRKYNARFK